MKCGKYGKCVIGSFIDKFDSSKIEEYPNYFFEMVDQPCPFLNV